ncbi:hypothetical protein ZHAS_00004954 [Anopheles sinensis]|uniref:Uncharacterized protein n=1 Tax=Anopheles sinensis TaxID=74873 RepID=A0A084VIJ5_ANOSI|nr:hypothetical protein ZHAS_00004954 [Anopheles sinensis]
MTEHPNYKYRPRRRKHAKARTGPGSGGAGAVGAGSIAGSAGTPGPTQNLISNSSPSELNYGDGDSSQRMSPYTYNPHNYYAGSNNALNTPDSSPTQSPEPIVVPPTIGSRKLAQVTANGGQSAGANGSMEKMVDDVSSALPTPEMSPLELEKEPFVGGLHSTHAGNNYDDLKSSKQKLTYEGLHDKRNYLSVVSSGATTTTAMVNGMYVMCTNRSILDQGHIVTGTYFPPLATSEDHQTLGTTTMTTTGHGPHLSTNGPGGNVHNQSNNGADYGIMYETHTLPGQDSDPVDSRELDKYLKYPDSNHNFNGYDGASYHYGLPQATSANTGSQQVLPKLADGMQLPGAGSNHLPTTPVALYALPLQHPQHLAGGAIVSPGVAGTVQHHGGHPLAHPNATMTDIYVTNEQQLKDDEFSNILAGVRKTCYSN